jgi:hypothetical protein
MNKNLELSVSETTWQNLEYYAHKFNLSLVEFLEKLGDQQFLIFTPEELEDYLDLQEAKQILEEARLNQEKPMSWEEFENQLDQI